MELQVSPGFSDHYKSEDIYWFGMFPVKKTVVEMFRRMVCLVCGFMAVPNILQASHSATDLCCLNAAAPAQLSAPDRRWTGGLLVCVCACVCFSHVLSQASELNTSISNLGVFFDRADVRDTINCSYLFKMTRSSIICLPS